MTRRIRIAIDRVVVSGAVPAGRVAFEHALKARLAAELGTPEAVRSLKGLHSAARLDGGVAPAAADPASLGRHIAGRLTGGGS